VWVPTEGNLRTLRQFRDVIDRALTAVGRAETQIRFVVSGTGDEEEDE
jgi:hypothetical protein